MHATRSQQASHCGLGHTYMQALYQLFGAARCAGLDVLLQASKALFPALQLLQNESIMDDHYAMSYDANLLQRYICNLSHLSLPHEILHIAVGKVQHDRTKYR